MRKVAKLTVPRLADLCVIDLLDERGAIKDVAVVAADAEIARGLEALRERAPLDPNGEHPVARVIRSGQPELLVEMADSSLRTFAENTTHAEFMIANNYRSAVVVPLQARNRTLGTISILRLDRASRSDRPDGPTTRRISSLSASSRDGPRWRSTMPACSPTCAASSSARRRS